MDNVPFRVNHNISIVTIFNLQQVSNDTVRSHRFHKITPRRLELFGCLIAIIVKEIFIQSRILKHLNIKKPLNLAIFDSQFAFQVDLSTLHSAHIQ